MKKLQNIFSALLILLTFIRVEVPAKDPVFLNYLKDSWVENQLKSMTPEEKIAQLITIAIYPDKGEKYFEEAVDLIKNVKPGGIIIMRGSPYNAASQINTLQGLSQIPLLVSTDAEWGLPMRFDSTLFYPNAQALGAVFDTAMVTKMAKDIGLQLRTLGIHMNYAPVADISSNPENPVISFRAFSDDKNRVAMLAQAYSNGLSQANVASVAKHFPGHGDTSADSHITLPVLDYPKDKLESREFIPFKSLINNGIPAIMTGHIFVHAFDSLQKPSSLSAQLINGYLKSKLGFKGLVITDAFNMNSVRSGTGTPEVEALTAGNDMIAYVTKPEKAIEQIKIAVQNKLLSPGEIDEKCRKILALKRWLELNNYKPAQLSMLTERLNEPEFDKTARELIKKSFTVLINQNNILPVQGFDTLKIATVAIGADTLTSFQEMAGNYTVTDHFYLPKDASQEEATQLYDKLKPYNLVLMEIEGIRLFPPDKFGTTPVQREAVGEIIRRFRTVTVLLGNVYALNVFDDIQKSAALVATYQNSDLTRQLAAQFVFGAFENAGNLPVTVNPLFTSGTGIVVKANQSFAYSIGEEVGIDSRKLQHKIDSLATLGLDSMAYPGCQVIVARNGNIILHRCYGYHTYEKLQKVEKANLYDFASVSKVTGALPSLMYLTDRQKFDIDAPISRYWPDFIGSNKENLHMREILAHQSGLPSGISFYTLGVDKKGNIDTTIFSKTEHGKFTVRVSQSLYMNRDFSQKMKDTLRNLKMLPQKKYVYSDLSFHLYPEIITRLSGIPYEEFITRTFYKPLGANSITYNPWKKVPLSNIIPTENDTYFRHENLRGFVHDESAAMMGGVSGNAGLFGTTLDLAKMFQMYLQKGYYGGKRYISEKTFNEFNRVQFPENDNRRGLGFDKPSLGNDTLTIDKSYPAVSAGKNSFGHSGYTGTFVWADPDTGVLFVYMTNRVHPTRNNNKLSDLRLRVLLQQAIYDSFLK